MNDINANQPAFPEIKTTDRSEIYGKYNPNVHSTGGLTKREYFAAMAMHGMLANSEIIKIMTDAKIHPDRQAEFLSVAAIEQGDELLKQLSLP